MDTMSNTTVPRLTIGQFLKSVVDLRIRFDPHLWMLTSLVRRNFVTLARGSPRGFDPQIKILPFSYIAVCTMPGHWRPTTRSDQCYK